MNMLLLIDLKHQNTVHRRWKQPQASWEECKDIACMCSDGVRKAKTQLELKLAREMKGNKKVFQNYC